MRKFWHIAITVFAVFALALTACGGGKPADKDDTDQDTGETTRAADFEGTYQVEGPDYTATLKIKKTGDGYHMEWTMADGSAFYGKGLVVNDVLGAVYDAGDASSSGITAFKKDGDGITGLWTSPDGEIFGFEKTAGAAKLRPANVDLEDIYAVAGKNPDGSDYTGQLMIFAEGDAWFAEWLIGEDELYGAGLAIDNVLVLGYGNDEFLGVNVYEIDDSDLDGIWMDTDYTSLLYEEDIEAGTEKAIR